MVPNPANKKKDKNKKNKKGGGIVADSAATPKTSTSAATEAAAATTTASTGDGGGGRRRSRNRNRKSKSSCPLNEVDDEWGKTKVDYVWNLSDELAIIAKRELGEDHEVSVFPGTFISIISTSYGEGLNIITVQVGSDEEKLSSRHVLET